MISLNQVPTIELFDADDREVADQILALPLLSAREQWAHPMFAAVYKRIKVRLKNHQDSTCFYCQVRNTLWTMDDWHVDHIVPLDEDPRHVFTSMNLLLACKACNRVKNDKAVLVNRPKSGKYSVSPANYRLVHGKIDRYDAHMEIIADRLYASKTAKGRRLHHDCVLDRFLLDFIININETNRPLIEASLRLILSGNVGDLIALARAQTDVEQNR